MRKDIKKKVLLTGGHAATTAISVIDEFKKRKGDFELYWIGAGKAFEGSDVVTLESKALPKMGIETYSINSARLQRKLTIWTLPSIVKLPIGFIQAAYLIIKIRPSITVSFGGYTSFPVVVVSKLFGIPVVLHEQTAEVGLANKISSYFAEKVLLARESSRKYFIKDKTELIGNPVMTQVKDVGAKTDITNPPVVLVMGGSRGSQAINNVLMESLSILLKKYKVIHVTGSANLKRVRDFAKHLGKGLDARYEIYGMVDPLLIDNIYKEADIVVSRAGANTVSELMIVKRPCILIPLPISYKNEQMKNAEFAKDYGIARILEQKDLSKDTLVKKIEEIENDWHVIVEKVSGKESPDKKADLKFVDTIEALLE